MRQLRWRRLALRALEDEVLEVHEVLLSGPPMTEEFQRRFLAAIEALGAIEEKEV